MCVCVCVCPLQYINMNLKVITKQSTRVKEHLEFELQLRQDRQQEVAVNVVQLQDQVKNMFRQITH